MAKGDNREGGMASMGMPQGTWQGGMGNSAGSHFGSGQVPDMGGSFGRPMMNSSGMGGLPPWLLQQFYSGTMPQGNMQQQPMGNPIPSQNQNQSPLMPGRGFPGGAALPHNNMLPNKIF